MPEIPKFNKKEDSFVYEGEDWKDSDADDWKILRLTSQEASEAAYEGQRKIDGERHNVFKFGPNQYAAQAV